MAVSVDKTTELHREDTYTADEIHATDLSNWMERINAQEELIKDAAAQGAGGRTYRGHDHNPGSGGTPCRGIARGRIGCFYKLSETTHTHAINSQLPESWHANTSYSNDVVAAGSPSTFNYVMGVCYVSPGVPSIRVEVCCKVDDITDAPQMRVKNLTDTTGSMASQIVASPWIDITTTDPQWYGLIEAEKLTVPVTRSDDLKRVELDIEIRLQAGDDSTNRTFTLYQAFPYEYVHEE